MVIRRGFGVADIEVTDDRVIVNALGHIAVGRWLVGCDGARSTVRKAPGFGFVGTEPEFTGYFGQGRNLGFGDAMNLGWKLAALLDFDESASLRMLSSAFKDRVSFLRVSATDRPGLSAVVVRPDDIVGWVSDQSNETGATAWLEQWFGR